MLFNSIEFVWFLPIVFIIYWSISFFKLTFQNFFIVIASYFFYGYWDWFLLVLIIASTLLDFSAGLLLKVEKKQSIRFSILLISIIGNLGMLFCFKYYNFFVYNFNQAFTFFGNAIELPTLQLILPVGISFYTLQTMSYTIDVYNRKIEATKDFISFSAFVSFFPQLVAGPIERATHLLPQFYSKRVFSYEKARDGMRQILWGISKKIILADTCAKFTNELFIHSENYSGSSLVLGLFLFTIQIYCDFSGYSDIAIGTARLFGFELMQNFNFPYFSKNIREFWQKWHISLSTWFRDYIYIPLGGNKKNKIIVIRNVFVVFILSGLWHGASWNFIVWGIIHAVLMLPSIVLRKHYFIQNKFTNSLRVLITFCIIMLTWVFFRTSNLSQAFHFIQSIFTPSLFSIPYIDINEGYLSLLIMILCFLIIEWNGRNYSFSFEIIEKVKQKAVRWVVYFCLLILIYFTVNNEENLEFIYFQF